MSFIESYERDLVRAAERRRDARPDRRFARVLRNWGRRRRGLAVALAALAVGVPAAGAAVGAWNPFADERRDPRAGDPPTLSDRPVAAALASKLGVLRRPQTAADRGPVTSERLRGADNAFRGARLDGVRVVGPGRDAVLVPFEQMPVPRDSSGRALPGFEGPEYRDVVCIFQRTSDGFGGAGCHNADRITRGLALASGGGEVSGLVPDGVARVRLVRGGDSTEAAVEDNFFSAAAPAPSVVEWLAPDGSLVKRIDLSSARSG